MSLKARTKSMVVDEKAVFHSAMDENGLMTTRTLVTRILSTVLNDTVHAPLHSAVDWASSV